MRISDWSSDVCSSDLTLNILRLSSEYIRKIIGEATAIFASGLNFNLSKNALHALRAQNLNENLKGQFGAGATRCEATTFHAYSKSIAFCSSIVHSRQDVAVSKTCVFTLFIALIASILII